MDVGMQTAQGWFTWMRRIRVSLINSLRPEIVAIGFVGIALGTLFSYVWAWCTGQQRDMCLESTFRDILKNHIDEFTIAFCFVWCLNQHPLPLPACSSELGVGARRFTEFQALQELEGRSDWKKIGVSLTTFET
jgi:hypothetical protein